MNNKIWYKNSDPVRIISTGKSVGELGESFFYSDVQPDDDEFYDIDQGPPQVIVRKSQTAIDSIITTRAQVATDYQQKHVDVDAKLALLAGKTYQQAKDSVQNNVTNLPTTKDAIADNRVVILAILKKLDFSN